MEQRACTPRPSAQLTSTVRDLEFAGFSTVLVSLGGDHSSSECLHNFMEQLWSKVMLKGLRGPKNVGGEISCLGHSMRQPELQKPAL